MKRVSRKKAWGTLVVVLLIAAGSYVLLDRFAAPDALPADAIVVPRDYATLSDALGAVGPNTTIVLEARDGPYLGPFIIDVQGITLMSTGGTATLTAGEGAVVLSIEADGVTIHDVAVTAGDVGIRVRGSSCRVRDVRVDRVAVGLELEGAREGSFERITICAEATGFSADSCAGNALTEIEIEGGETGLLLEGCTANRIAGVLVKEADVGISLQDSSENIASDCCVRDCAIVGVEVVGGQGNQLLGLEAISGYTGVLIQGGSQNGLFGSTVTGSEQTGVILQSTAQNRVEDCTISACETSGILLTNSEENVLLGNDVYGCTGTGVTAESSDRILCLRNRIAENGVGIEVHVSSDGRLLRNTLEDNRQTSVLLYRAERYTILDNETSSSPFGLVLVDSGDSTVMRNVLVSHRSVALAVCVGSDRAWIGDNEMCKNQVGLLLLETSRAIVSANALMENAEGVRLVDPGYGIRIEGNTFSGNAIGLSNTTTLEAVEGLLAEMGILLRDGQDERYNPQVAYNTFRRNTEFDVANTQQEALYLENNLWGSDATADPQEALVSSGVVLPAAVVAAARLSIGTSTDTAELVLGRVLQHALLGKGNDVVDLIGLGSADSATSALNAGDVDLIAWSDDRFLDTQTSSQTASTEYVWLPIAAVRGWVVVVSRGIAEQLSEPTASSLSAFTARRDEPVRIAGPSEIDDQIPDTFLTALGIDPENTDWVDAGSRDEAELLLKFGEVDAAVLDSLTETVTLSGFVLLSDVRTAFEPSTLGLLYAASVDEHMPTARGCLEDLASRLTTDVVRGLVSRVRLLHREPGDVALEFLIDEGVLAQ